MCDYSLEMYASRPARASEKYVTTRFPSGSIGLASPGDCTTAICVQYDTHLKLEGISKRASASGTRNKSSSRGSNTAPIAMESNSATVRKFPSSFSAPASVRPWLQRRKSLKATASGGWFSKQWNNSSQ
jgi:hypothetical protein